MIGTETSMREGLGLGLGERITRKEGGREGGGEVGWY
jgi:hypothetical protein